MTPFDCTRHASWLDQGDASDPAAAAAAAAHAASCPSCAARGAADRAVHGLLAVDPATSVDAPGGFLGRVMARVTVTPQDAPLAAVSSPATEAAAAPALAAFAFFAGRDAFPWWVRAAVQPASVLALVLASVAVVFAPQLAGVSQAAPQWSAAAFAVVTGAIVPWLVRIDALAGADPVAGTGMALALLALVLLASTALFHLGAALAGARFATFVRRGRSVPGA